MDVIDKVMVFLGFERDYGAASDGNGGKVLYKKRGVDIIPGTSYQHSTSQGQAAARAHVKLTMFDRAVLWIFEKIVSPFLQPSTPEAYLSGSLQNQAAVNEADQVARSVAESAAEKAKNTEKSFSDTKAYIQTFSEKNIWPSGGHVFEEDVTNLASSYWKVYESLPDKSTASDEDQLNYQTAAFVLGKGKPSFEPEAKVLMSPPPPSRSPVKHDAMVREEGIIVERPIPQISKGEELFRQFFALYAAKNFSGLESLGSPFFQPESLEFARKIIEENNRIKKTFTTPPSGIEVTAAEYLRARKTALEGVAEENTRRQEELAKAEQIKREKASLPPGAWDFMKFVEKFVDFRDKDLPFILLKNGEYLKNTDMLSFAATVRDTASATPDQKQAAEYLSKWSRNPDAATEAAGKEYGFSWPPEPAAPPPRRVAVPEMKRPPIPPEQAAVSGLLLMDARAQGQLQGLIGLDAEVFRSGLDLIATLWPGVSTPTSDKDPSGPSSMNSNGLALAYTDLEQADNAIKVINAIVKLNTGHNSANSATVERMKSHREPIVQRLTEYRRQIIGNRQIILIENLTADQMSRGQQIFDEFRRSFEAALSRGEPDRLIMRDLYFSDECMSYAAHLQTIYSTGAPLTNADQQSLTTVAFLMSKYNQFKSPAEA